jgi:hypothetical protein
MTQPMPITFVEFYVVLAVVFAIGYAVGHRGRVFDWVSSALEKAIGTTPEVEMEEVPFARVHMGRYPHMRPIEFKPPPPPRVQERPLRSLQARTIFDHEREMV